MRKLICIISFICLMQNYILNGQNEDSLSLMFWNLENLFDIYNDSLTMDEEFLPEGTRHWTTYRYYAKINFIWKVMLSTGNNHPPDLMAFAEVENRKVLNDLLIYSPFGKFGYRIIHTDSPDRRGIDVAFAYNPEKIVVDSFRYIENDQRSLGGGPTRDILYCRCRIKTEYLHLFVNHWPSKYGGQAYTEPFRLHAARLLKTLTDSLKGEKIICLGDFNDTPDSECIQNLINKEDGKLILLKPQHANPQGSIKFQGLWQYIDHFMVSHELLNNKTIFYSSPDLSYIYAPSFLLEKDQVYGGIKPFRTWSGFQYKGGVSDHLPIVLRMIVGEEIPGDD